jgi:hypothetical protein
VVKERDGRRNRYRIQEHLPLRVRVGREPTVGELLRVLVGTGTTDSMPGPDQDGKGSTRRTRGERGLAASATDSNRLPELGRDGLASGPVRSNQN